MVVWKYPILDGEGEFVIKAPAGANFVGITVQDNEPYLYAVVDAKREVVEYKFYARDTGQPLKVSSTTWYIGWYEVELQSISGTYVRHVFMCEESHRA